jgi:hypothetical protein
MERGIADKDMYFVAVKAFLERDGELLIFKDRYGDWDLPGGRCRHDEFATPLVDVLRRKIAEELGDGFAYDIGPPRILMRHQRMEAAPGNPTVRIFAVGYEARFMAGDVRMSPQHVEMKWVKLSAFDPTMYFRGGWLAGVRDYLAGRAGPSGLLG